MAPGVRRPWPPHWGRAAGSTRSGRTGAFFRRLRGDASRRALPPGSHRPRVAHGRVRRYSSPSTPLARPSVRGWVRRGRPVFAGSAVRPNV
ncbi:hypothetical protein CU044_0581 [Streptomyces sp. L-9-10]|nr:hypothetical protein CU044_0581 [Streptomyces sp. L-9-10]